jgi:hypothetical protein
MLSAAGVLAASLWLSEACCADRVVLGPTGSTLSEDSYKSEFAVGSSIGNGDYIWGAYSSADGIEMELNRFEADTETKKRWAMSIEYPMPTLKNLPAISLGVRDISGTGVEHGALYIASTVAVPLSKAQHTLFRGINLSMGAGTGRIGGAFVGVESRIKLGLTIDAEVYRHRPNFSVGLPLIRNMQVKAYSLDGETFYGMSYRWSR